MYWGCISGRFGKGFSVFWRNLGGQSLQRHILIILYPKLLHIYKSIQVSNSSRTTLLDTGLGMHTLRVLASYGIIPVLWPPNSPDISPIEDICDWQKDIMDILDPTTIATTVDYGLLQIGLGN
jgi:hypothetical protein